ncbi:MAG: flagellar type III secretion system pore protein FliP [Chitinivibrionales bacterium]|nr:flagellar type III secretion system pore protein FliP [Chitinivibrionales bacterium]
MKRMYQSLIVILLFSSLCAAQVLPKVTLSFDQASKPGDVSVALQLLFLVTILTLAPSILIMLTSFTRLIIVFSFLRRALGTQTVPPDQVLVGLSLFLTAFIMMPVMKEINTTALQPYLAEKITWKEGVQRSALPMRTFMLKQTDEKDLAMFIRIAKRPIPKSAADLTFDVIVPAFITSELKKSFIIGFIIFIPFLVIDMIIASILLAMGMMMLPPIMISLPFKIILFVLIDGWTLLVQQMVVSFH